mmetsp:Transcript_53835/g.122723  ORF Transcript_53835/g.122723 Transcript_53835/m.122723 type:complete len:200 (+) Transcript_53835:233-832(+)
MPRRLWRTESNALAQKSTGQRAITARGRPFTGLGGWRRRRRRTWLASRFARRTRVWCPLSKRSRKRLGDPSRWRRLRREQRFHPRSGKCRWRSLRRMGTRRSRQVITKKQSGFTAWRSSWILRMRFFTRTVRRPSSRRGRPSPKPSWMPPSVSSSGRIGPKVTRGSGRPSIRSAASMRPSTPTKTGCACTRVTSPWPTG